MARIDDAMARPRPHNEFVQLGEHGSYTAWLTLLIDTGASAGNYAITLKYPVISAGFLAPQMTTV